MIHSFQATGYPIVSQLNKCLKFKSIRGIKMTVKKNPKTSWTFLHLFSCDTICRILGTECILKILKIIALVLKTGLLGGILYFIIVNNELPVSACFIRLLEGKGFNGTQQFLNSFQYTFWLIEVLNTAVNIIFLLIVLKWKPQSNSYFSIPKRLKLVFLALQELFKFKNGNIFGPVERTDASKFQIFEIQVFVFNYRQISIRQMFENPEFLRFKVEWTF